MTQEWLGFDCLFAFPTILNPCQFFGGWGLSIPHRELTRLFVLSYVFHFPLIYPMSHTMTGTSVHNMIVIHATVPIPFPLFFNYSLLSFAVVNLNSSSLISSFLTCNIWCNKLFASCNAAIAWYVSSLNLSSLCLIRSILELIALRMSLVSTALWSTHCHRFSMSDLARSMLLCISSMCSMDSLLIRLSPFLPFSGFSFTYFLVTCHFGTL